MDDLAWGAPFLPLILLAALQMVRWLRRSPRCPYCSARIANGRVMCRRCEHGQRDVLDVGIAELFEAPRGRDEAGTPEGRARSYISGRTEVNPEGRSRPWHPPHVTQRR